MEEKKLISVSDASCLLRVSERQVRRYCNEGRLICYKDGKAFEIEYDSVLAFLKSDFTPESDADIESDKGVSGASDADTNMSDVRIAEGDVRKDETDVRKAEKIEQKDVAKSSGAETQNLKVAATQSDISPDISSQLQSSLQTVVELANQLAQQLALERKRNRVLKASLIRFLKSINEVWKTPK